ncbi:MAG: hypothetical protein RMJ28_04730 [Nitrososphaerota archaeon]|nr:hypothetical protein [Candidatus Calditenuaceae archaeon]MDW8073525.1 hypothetical protein [Nitrososphaerota archaeon]
MSIPSVITRPIRIIYSPGKVIAEINEKPGTGAALLIFFLVVASSITLDLLISLPRLEIVNIFKTPVPTPTVDTRFVIARQIAYFFIAIGVLFGVLWIFSFFFKKKSGNLLSVLSSLLNGFLILFVFITIGALISLALPPSTIVVYGYEANGVTFRDLSVEGMYSGVEVPAGVRGDILSNGSTIKSPLARATKLRAEAVDKMGVRVNLTGLSDAEKREVLEKSSERVTLEKLLFSEAVINGVDRIAVPFNISKVLPRWLNWSAADVESYTYIDATLMGLTEMSSDEMLLTSVRRALSPLAWLWISGLGAYALNVVYGLSRFRAGLAWALAFVLMTLMGLV